MQLMDFDIVREAVTDGVIVEIGGGHGDTTLELLKIAKEKGTKVIVIDPFDGDMPESYRYSMEDFLKKIKPYHDQLILWKYSSLDYAVEVGLNNMNIDFAFIDGLQYKDAVLNDLRITEHAKVVCVDDYNRSTEISQVPEAIEEYMKTSNKKLTIKGRWAYLTT